jgi:hypothetical protein
MILNATEKVFYFKTSNDFKVADASLSKITFGNAGRNTRMNFSQQTVLGKLIFVISIDIYVYNL